MNADKRRSALICVHPRLLLPRSGKECERGAAHKQKCAADDACLVGDLANAGVGDDDAGLCLNVKSAVSDHATRSGHQNTNDEEESLQLLAFERGLALLKECADAFVFVFRRKTKRKQINFAS